MGIIRYPVQCPGCETGIILRLAVGHEPIQPFFYVCPKCKAATRGRLNWDGGAGTSLDLSDGKLLSSEDGCNTAVNINPEIPSYAEASSLSQQGGSAFITFAQLLGNDGIRHYQQALGTFLGLKKAHWNALQRLTTYYVNRDWTHFDAAIKPLIPVEAQDFSQPWVRSDRILRLYDILLGPIWALDKRKHCLELRKSFNGLWDCTGSHFKALVSFAKAEVGSGLLQTTEHDLFTQIDRYVTLINGLLPGLLCDLIPAAQQPEVDRMRLFRDDYEGIRDLYIQSFESCHRSLRWVVGAANASANGSENSFVLPAPAPYSLKKPLKDLDAYSDAVSAEKRKWLFLVPEWDRRWDELFDRHLRNDIGHASARHNLATGEIQRDSNPPISYTRFVQKAQRILHPLIMCSNVIKIIRIYSTV